MLARKARRGNPDGAHSSWSVDNAMLDNARRKNVVPTKSKRITKKRLSLRCIKHLVLLHGYCLFLFGIFRATLPIINDIPAISQPYHV